MQLTNHTNDNYTIRQLKLPLEIEKIIDIADPVYTFCEVMDHIDLTPYFVDDKDCKTYRPITKSNTIRIHGVWNLFFERNREVMPK